MMIWNQVSKRPLHLPSKNHYNSEMLCNIGYVESMDIPLQIWTPLFNNFYKIFKYNKLHTAEVLKIQSLCFAPYVRKTPMASLYIGKPIVKTTR